MVELIRIRLDIEDTPRAILKYEYEVCTLNAAGVEIPYPQRVVRTIVVNESSAD